MNVFFWCAHAKYYTPPTLQPVKLIDYQAKKEGTKNQVPCSKLKIFTIFALPTTWIFVEVPSRLWSNNVAVDEKCRLIVRAVLVLVPTNRKEEKQLPVLNIK